MPQYQNADYVEFLPRLTSIMHFSTIFLHLAAIVQVKAAAVGQASYFVSKINLSIIGANSQNATVQKKTELSVEFTGTAPDHPYGPSCGLYTTFPVPPDEWSFCPGGEFYIRARGLTNSAKIEFDLDFARMQSKGFVEYGLVNYHT
jgi:hypothetical protein